MAASDPVPLLFTLLLFFLLCMGLGILYFQYRSVQRELTFCRSVHTLQRETRRYLQPEEQKTRK